MAGALWLSLYCMKCKRHVIALLYHYALAIVVEAIVGETTTMQWWRSRCRAGDNGDHNDALEMEIKSIRWWWPYHVTYFDYMWCLSFVHLIFLSTTVALSDDPLPKFQGISVLPEYAPLRQFVVLRHHVMIGCDKLYVHIQRVQDSFAHAEYSG